MALASRSAEEVLANLKQLLGPDALASSDDTAAYSVGGGHPMAVVSPADEAEVVRLVRFANEECLPVVVWGKGTKQGVPPVQPSDGIVVRTARLNQTVEMDTGNLTVTVGTGKVLADLQKELAEQRMFLPLDPVDGDRATIGGTLATNSSGPGRLLYRTARDWLLGVRVVTATGEPARFGGKTIKDVAGYDMKKLYLGSWGTLGLITEATLRLLPLPESRATVAVSFPRLQDACATVTEILGSFLIPSAMDLISAGALPEPMAKAAGVKEGEYLLLIAAEGAVEAVDRLKRDLPEMAAKNGSREAASFEGEADGQLWQWRRGLFAAPSQPDGTVLVKGSVLLTRVFDFISGLNRIGEEGSIAVSTASHAGNGIVYALLQPQDGAAPVATAVEGAQRLAAGCGGFLVVQRAPDEVVRQVQLWPPRSDYGLMRRIKSQLDPNNLWSPARVPGGRS